MTIIAAKQCKCPTLCKSPEVCLERRHLIARFDTLLYTIYDLRDHNKSRLLNPCDITLPRINWRRV